MVDKFVENTQNTNKTQMLASNYCTFRSLVVCENFNPKTDPLRSSSMQALFKCESTRLQLESSATFLAIKCCQGTTIGKVIKLAQNSIKSWVHIICVHSHRGKAVDMYYFLPSWKVTIFHHRPFFKSSCVLLLSRYILMISTSYILDFAWSTRTIKTMSLIKKNFALTCFFFPLDKRPFFISSCGYGASQWGTTLVKSNILQVFMKFFDVRWLR